MIFSENRSPPFGMLSSAPPTGGDACLAGDALPARLRHLARRAFRRGRHVGRHAADRRVVREETAGADPGVVRDALHDADQHVALAVELRDRAAAVAHAGAGADRAAAARIDQRVVAAVVDQRRLLQAGRTHARAFLRGAVAGDGVGAFAAGRAGRDRDELRGQGARQSELRGLSGRAVARDRDALAAGHHVERAGAFDAVIGGQQLLAPDHDRSAQKIMADQLHDVAADSAGGTAAHHRMGIARGKNKGGRTPPEREATAET